MSPTLRRSAFRAHPASLFPRVWTRRSESPLAYALFAHASPARRIEGGDPHQRVPRERGVAVLGVRLHRVGGSGGEFAIRTFFERRRSRRCGRSSRRNYAQPAILIAYSLGGTAVLAARRQFRNAPPWRRSARRSIPGMYSSDRDSTQAIEREAKRASKIAARVPIKKHSSTTFGAEAERDRRHDGKSAPGDAFAARRRRRHRTRHENISRPRSTPRVSFARPRRPPAFAARRRDLRGSTSSPPGPSAICKRNPGTSPRRRRARSWCARRAKESSPTRFIAGRNVIAPTSGCGGGWTRAVALRSAVRLPGRLHAMTLRSYAI